MFFSILLDSYDAFETIDCCFILDPFFKLPLFQDLLQNLWLLFNLIPNSFFSTPVLTIDIS